MFERLQCFGRLVSVTGSLLEATGVKARVGDWCWLELGAQALPLEVVGFAGERTLLMPLQPLEGSAPGMAVSMGEAPRFPDHRPLLGRVIDAVGRPLDDGPLIPSVPGGAAAGPINPLRRAVVDQVFDVGIRAINGLLTLGVGQRVGLFAGSGVGKSVLLGMLARFSAADVVVIGLIGERGREVKEFIVDNLGEARDHCIVLAAPADDSPGLRLRAAVLAHEIAQRYRDEGRQVLLLLDSLTRVAQAQREIGLAAGEPPTSKGYPPSAFGVLPGLIERAGGLRGSGAITAIYTVLMEEDDLSDPIVDAARAVLDGHIVLSRRIAERGHYPAIDLGASISRVANRLQDDAHREASLRFRRWWTRYEAQADLIAVGAYEAGSDPVLDEAIARHAALADYLQQGTEAPVYAAESQASLKTVTAQRSVPAAPVAAPVATSISATP
ncbi:MAG: FliI/YscN family ATPase [Pseudomonadota bacterium]